MKTDRGMSMGITWRGEVPDEGLRKVLKSAHAVTVSRAARKRVPGCHSSVRERSLHYLQSWMPRGARLQDCTVLCGSGGPLGYL